MRKVKAYKILGLANTTTLNTPLLLFPCVLPLAVTSVHIDPHLPLPFCFTLCSVLITVTPGRRLHPTPTSLGSSPPAASVLSTLAWRSRRATLWRRIIPKIFNWVVVEMFQKHKLLYTLRTSALSKCIPPVRSSHGARLLQTASCVCLPWVRRRPKRSTARVMVLWIRSSKGIGPGRAPATVTCRCCGSCCPAVVVSVSSLLACPSHVEMSRRGVPEQAVPPGGLLDSGS